MVVMTAELVKPLGHSLQLLLYQAGQALLILSKAGKQTEAHVRPLYTVLYAEHKHTEEQ